MLSGAIVKCDDACRLRGVVVKIDTSVAADKVSLQMTCFLLYTLVTLLVPSSRSYSDGSVAETLTVLYCSCYLLQGITCLIQCYS